MCIHITPFAYLLSFSWHSSCQYQSLLAKIININHCGQDRAPLPPPFCAPKTMPRTCRHPHPHLKKALAIEELVQARRLRFCKALLDSSACDCEPCIAFLAAIARQSSPQQAQWLMHDYFLTRFTAYELQLIAAVSLLSPTNCSWIAVLCRQQVVLPQLLHLSCAVPDMTSFT